MVEVQLDLLKNQLEVAKVLLLLQMELLLLLFQQVH